MCCDAEDLERNFQESAMNRVIDKYANSITLFVTVPPPAPPRPAQPLTNGAQEGFQDNFVDKPSKGKVEESSDPVCRAGGVAVSAQEYAVADTSPVVATEGQVTPEGNTVAEALRENGPEPLDSEGGCEVAGRRGLGGEEGIGGGGDRGSGGEESGDCGGSGEKGSGRRSLGSEECGRRGEGAGGAVLEGVGSGRKGSGGETTKRPLQRSECMLD